jgi:hypothetical protein
MNCLLHCRAAPPTSVGTVDNNNSYPKTAIWQRLLQNHSKAAAIRMKKKRNISHIVQFLGM